MEIKYWDSAETIEGAVIDALKLDPAKLGNAMIEHLHFDFDGAKAVYQAATDEIAKAAVLDFVGDIHAAINPWTDGDITFVVDSLDWNLCAEDAGDEDKAFGREFSFRTLVSECAYSKTHMANIASVLESIASEIRGKGP